MKQRTSLRTQLTVMLLLLLCAGSVKGATPLEIGIALPWKFKHSLHIIVAPIPIIWWS